MTTLTERFHAGGFLVSEAQGTRSRQAITVLSGEVLLAGAVIAKITASGKWVAWDKAASAEGDGSTSAAGILFDDVDATDGDADGVAIVRDAEVNLDELVWPTGAQQSEKDDAIAALLLLGIVGR